MIKNHDIPVVVTMDSQYVIKGINEWILGWLRKGWKNSNNETVENIELWKELLELKKSFKAISFVKCKGHSDNEGNNIADSLANKAMDEITAGVL